MHIPNDKNCRQTITYNYNFTNVECYNIIGRAFCKSAKNNIILVVQRRPFKNRRRRHSVDKTIVVKKKKNGADGRPAVAQQVRSRWRFSKSITVAAACFTGNRTPYYIFCVRSVLFHNPFLVEIGLFFLFNRQNINYFFIPVRLGCFRCNI